MAILLYRLGRLSFRRRWRVLALWLLLLALLGGGAAAFIGPTTSKFSIPGTESQKALDSLAREFPQASGATGSIVVAAPEGAKLTPQAVAPVTEEASKVPGVLAAVDPFASKAVSRDGRYALVQVQFESGVDGITDSQREAFSKAGESVPDLRVEHGGEIMRGVPEVGSTEIIGVAVAALVLVLTFGSLVAAGMTLLNALVGVAAGMAGQEAAGRAAGTAGSAVVFAGATVVIALAGLTVAGVPFLTVMGLAAAATVALAVLVSLTLLPAVLCFAGERVLPRKLRAKDRARTQAPAPAEAGFGFRWGRIVARLRVPVLVLGVAGLGALALPVQDMRLALPDASTEAVGSPNREAYDLTTEGFGEGFNGRLVAVVAGDSAKATASAAEETATIIGGTDGVLAVAAPQMNEAGTTALLSVIPETGPTDATTEDTVNEIRDRVKGVEGVAISLTGATAVGIDVSEKLAGALPVYLLLVVGLSVLLLMLVFRSVLVPLKAALGFLLTIGATFGITVAIFQEGHLASWVGLDTSGPLVSFLPILLIGILFGLAMDYEVFLVSRMREDFVHGADARESVVSGVGHNARVVTAAAVIMTAVFGGFVFMPDPIIKSIGFALAIGVLIDAFVVRMAIVPAVMHLLGRAAWWLPRPVDRILPDLDIEGERLQREIPVQREPAELVRT